ncbi:hypothetical protein O0L34_g5528 [Tuta absoluta]|nr:hypothetical protein O0L34_g5528 [Tuta absoluta]
MMMTLQSKTFVGLVTLVFFSFQSSLVSAGKRKPGSLRIYKGDSILDASHEDYPYVMVLTMMKTVYPFQANTTKYQTNIRKIFQHFGYKGNNVEHKMDEGIMLMDPAILKDDIALILVDPLDNIVEGKISAVDYRSLAGYAVTYLGAGGTYSFSDFFNDGTGHNAVTRKEDQVRPLQIGKAVIVQCALASNPFDPKLSGICVQSKCSKSHQSLNEGDGGAPLLYKGKIVGIATMVTPAAGSMKHRYGAIRPIYRKDVGNVGAVYTAVSPYLNWINSVILSEDSNCRKAEKKAKPASHKRKKDQPKQIQL